MDNELERTAGKMRVYRAIEIKLQQPTSNSGNPGSEVKHTAVFCSPGFAN
uniref:Uncharacterized protein n=1 Tax=Anguilla anguilla TaxID=7936 RepID=A0A0E9SZS5_ANGAN